MPSTGIITGLGGGSGGGGGGFIFITEVTPTNAGDNVAPLTYVPGTVPAEKVLLTCSADTRLITVHFEAEGGGGENFTPLVQIDGVFCANLQKISDRYFEGSVAIEITKSGAVKVASSTGQSASVDVVLGARPVVESVVWDGVLPGTQTELKENNTVTVTVKADMAFNSVIVNNAGAAGYTPTISVQDGTEADITFNIADRGSHTSTFPLLPVTVKVITSEGSTSDPFTSDDIFPCNNLHPSFTPGTIEYPTDQEALKDGEEATVPVTIAYADTYL
ncbi:MAG: hypothetical protein HN929_10270, partial [Chloroflexi bacterium]|nr:hypothetical protein [Chloroflexota bacterium]